MAQNWKARSNRDVIQLYKGITLPGQSLAVLECAVDPSSAQVPLNCESRGRFHIINGGYDNLELSTDRVRLPPDTTSLPLRLSFPEGNLIGLAKDRLPVDVTFCSTKPLSFTAMVDFLDESGRAFSLAVTGAADSCSLTHQPFIMVHGLNFWGFVWVCVEQGHGGHARCSSET